MAVHPLERLKLNRAWLKKRAAAASEAIENFNGDAEEFAIEWAWTTILTFEARLADAEQRAAQAEKDKAEINACLYEANRDIDYLSHAERDAVRECESLTSRYFSNDYAAMMIRKRYPQHFGGE